MEVIVMAMDAKVSLMNEMERALAAHITTNDTQTVLSLLADTLQCYKLEKIDAAGAAPDDMLDAYCSALSVEGRSPKTIDRYRYIMGRFSQSAAAPTRQVTVYHLRKYLADEKARGISDRTLEGYRQVFSAYFGWLHREGLIAQNPAGNLSAIKYAKKEKDIFTDADIERMKFSCASVRDRAIVHFLRATGCRISEMTQLNRDDVDFANLECKVLGKGNKERVVYLDAVAGMVLQNYLKNRTDACPALFIGKGSDRLTPHGVRFMLSKLGQASQVQHVHPHKFRRTTATNLIRHGMPIQEVAAILGHDKLDTTMQYVVLDKSTIKSSYRKYA